jgi:hypothetical protein
MEGRRRFLEQCRSVLYQIMLLDFGWYGYFREFSQRADCLIMRGVLRYFSHNFPLAERVIIVIPLHLHPQIRNLRV